MKRLLLLTYSIVNRLFKGVSGLYGYHVCILSTAYLSQDPSLETRGRFVYIYFATLQSVYISHLGLWKHWQLWPLTFFASEVIAVDTDRPLFGTLYLKQCCIESRNCPSLAGMQCKWKAPLWDETAAEFGCSSRLRQAQQTLSEPKRRPHTCPIRCLLPPVACITGFALCMVSMPTFKKA